MSDQPLDGAELIATIVYNRDSERIEYKAMTDTPSPSRAGERLIERLEQIADTHDGPLVPSTCREAIEALRTAEQERDEARLQLAEAAQKINCAGPVAHRIDVLRQQCDAQLTARDQTIRELREATQRERDRAQAIIHRVLAGGRVGWGMLLKDGAPDVEAIAKEPLTDHGRRHKP